MSKVEKLRNAGQLLLRLDFENDIKKILLFLKDVGVEDNQLGPFLTKNPYIFTEDMEALETRYLFYESTSSRLLYAVPANYNCMSKFTHLETGITLLVFF